MSGYSSDDEPRMKFSTENDFEGGQWIEGEFFSSGKKQSDRQSNDDRIYGVFQDTDSGDSGSDSDGESKRRMKLPRRNKPASSTSRSVVFVPGGTSAGSTPAIITNEAVLLPADGAGQDSAAEQVRSIIKETTAAPKSNDSFRDMLKQEEKREKEKIELHQKRLSSVNTKDLGQWEKHTKGVGRKLLDKFGFKGRLGANEDGISAAVEVKVRPSTMGLGFGDFVEASALEVNKRLEAELKKEEYIPLPKKGRLVETDKDEFTVEKRAASLAWKKGMTPAVGDKHKRGVRGTKVLFRDAMEIMQTEQVEGVKPLFIDMRGPTPKVVSDIKDVHTNEDSMISAQDIVKPKLGQELLYNVNIMVDGIARELDFEARKYRQIVTKCDGLSNQKIELKKIIIEEETKLDRLNKIYLILGRIEEKIDNEMSAISAEDIFRAFAALKAKFTLEYSLLGITELLPHICRRMVSCRFGPTWEPLSCPSLIAETFVPWFLGACELEKTDENPDDEPAPVSSSVTPALMQVVESLCLFRIRRCISTEWNPKKDPEIAVELLSGLYGSGGCFINHKELHSLLISAVMPRLRSEVEKWDPTSDMIPIHWWLHPWLSLLKADLSDLYPDIRRKLGRALAGWNPSDESAMLLIAPWKGVFDDTSMDNLIQRAIVPKLVSAIRGIPLDPLQTTAEHTKLFSAVISWYKLVPRIHMLCILEGEFFPRWLQILCSWLTSESPDFSEISDWYVGWKSLLPAEMLSDESIALYFNHALEVMQHVLNGDNSSITVLPHGVVDDGTYFSAVERRKRDAAAVKRLQELRTEQGAYSSSIYTASSNSTSSVSFKDLVEEFALRHNLTFLPRTGRLQEGKQVFQFGKSNCFLDQGVVFLHRKKSDGGSSWNPVTLEDMLQVS